MSVLTMARERDTEIGDPVFVRGFGFGVVLAINPRNQFRKVHHECIGGAVWRRDSELVGIVKADPRYKQVLETFQEHHFGFHRALIGGIETRDMAQAETLMRAHIAATMEAATHRYALTNARARIDFDYLLTNHDRITATRSLFIVAWLRTLWQTTRRLSIPALPAPKQEAPKVVPIPEVVVAEKREAA